MNVLSGGKRGWVGREFSVKRSKKWVIVKSERTRNDKRLPGR